MAFQSQKSMDAATVHGVRPSGRSRRAFIALAPSRTTADHAGMGNGPGDEARPVVLRESSVVLGSLASGALSPKGARRVGRIGDPIRSVGALPVSVSRGL